MYTVTSATKQSTTSTASRQQTNTGKSAVLQRKSNSQDAEALSQIVSRGSPANSIHFSHTAHSNSQSMCLSRLVQNSPVQAKLAIGKSNDRYEQEADRVAQTVTTAPSPAIQRSPNGQEEKKPVQAKLQISSLQRQSEQKEEEKEEAQTKLQRQEEKEKEVQAKAQIQPQEEEKEEAQTKLQRQEEKEEPIQEKSTEKKEPRATLRDKKEFPVLDKVEDKIQREKGKGEELDAETRTSLEASFGTDFTNVRIHKDQEAADLSRELKAQAFTHESDIYFNTGKYEPDSLRGKVLLAHELTHVVQQGAAEKNIPEARIEENNTQKDAREPEPRDKEVQEVITKNEALEASLVKEKAGVTGERELKAGRGGEPIESKKAGETAEGEGGAKETVEGTTEEKLKEKELKGEKKGKKGAAVGEYLRAQAKPAVKKGAQNIASLVVNETTKDDPETKLAQTEKAVVPPAEEGQSQANASQVDTVDKTPAPKTEEAKAQQEFTDTLENVVPKSLEEVDEFKERGKGRVVGEAVKSVVSTDTRAVQTTYQEIENTPPPPPPEHTPEELPALEDAPETPELALGEGVVADLKTEHTDLSEFEQESDSLLEKEGITEEQLEMVDEGELLEAKNERKGVKEKVKNAPTEVNDLKEQEKQKVHQDLKQEEVQAKNTMKAERKKQLTGAKNDQKETRSKLELKRQEVTENINKIYEKANTTVKQKLETLENQSLKAFDEGERQASQTFENNVKRRLDAFKRRRYDRLGGSVLWLKDKLLGMDDLPEVKEIFESEKAIFVNTINTLVKNITAENKKAIQECKDIIAAARQEIEAYVKNLGPALQKTGQEALTAMKTKLDALDNQVNQKEQELKKKLEAKKEAAIKAIEEKIEKMKEEMSGALAKLGNFLLDAMLKFFSWALKKAGYDEKQLMSIINKGKAVIKKIVGDPIGFIKNIIKAVKDGINNFVTNIKKHLVAGLINWLTGAMGDIGIQLPDTFDLRGILSIVLQILGLTWTAIRQKLVKRLGEKVVSVVEKSVDIVKRIISEGPMALWEMLKEKATEIKEQVMEGIRNWAITELVKQGIIKLLSFLNPVGAIVQAILAIYNTIMFFVENWQRIVEFVKTVFDSIGDIAMGKLSAAAAAVEKAMAMTIPIILNFLARLLNLSGIGKAVKKIIQKIRKPIDKVVDKAIDFIAKQAKGLVKRGKAAVARVVNWWRTRKQFKDRAGKSHVLSFRGRRSNARLVVASHEITLDTLLATSGQFERQIIASGNSAKTGALSRARTEHQKVKSAQSILQRTPNDPNVTRQLNVSFNSLGEQLAITGVGVVSDADLPDTFITHVAKGNKAGSVTASPLSKKGSGGSRPDKNIVGWQHVLTIDAGNWERTHLVSEAFHGPGRFWNLIPARRTDNAWMREGPERSIKTMIKRNVVLHYQVEVNSYHNLTHPNTGQPIDGFPESISITLSTMKKQSNNWVRDVSLNPFPRKSFAPPTLIDGNRVDLKTANDNALRSLGIPRGVAGNVGRVKGSGSFLNQSDFQTRMQAYYQTLRPPYNVDFMATYWPLFDNLINSGRAFF